MHVKEDIYEQECQSDSMNISMQTFNKSIGSDS